MYLYFLKRQKLSHPDIGDYLSYGIGAYKLFGGTKPLVFIPDVSTDGKAVARFTASIPSSSSMLLKISSADNRCIFPSRLHGSPWACLPCDFLVVGKNIAFQPT